MVANTSADGSAALTHSAPALTNSATSRTLHFTVSRLVGGSAFVEGANRTEISTTSPGDVVNSETPPGLGEVGAARLDGGQSVSRAVDDQLLDRGALAELGLGLGPANHSQHLADRPRIDTSPSNANGAASGHGMACTDPSCHQLHTSSVTNGRNGANSR